MLAILILAGLACGDTDPPPPPAPSTYQVTYEVTGSTYGVSVTYENDQGGTEQGDYEIPFKKTYTMDRGDFAYISAQNMDDSGSVTCKILIDGEDWRESTSQGAYVIASCDGLVGND
jgi:hypothetical protein